MEIFIAILCFLNGAVLASCFFIAFGRGKPPRIDDKPKTEREKKEQEMARQWENCMNYNGTSDGQRGLRDDD